MLDLEILLKPAPAEPPAGPNLQYSPEYAAFERLAAGKPDRQVGGASVPAEPPDWKGVLEQARPLLVASKDLRVAITLTRGLLETQAFAGFTEGLVLVRSLMERFWEGVHPQLDVEDGNDPTSRVNAMSALTHRDMLQAVRGAPLLVSRAFGPISLRSLDAAASAAKTPPDPKAPPGQSTATLEAGFQEAGLEALTQAATTLARCVGEAKALAEAWAARLPTSGPDFTELRRLLLQAESAVRSRLEQRHPGGAVPAGGGGGSSGAMDAPVGSSGAPAPVPQGLTGEVRTREDVIRAIDAICAYYARTEPSSPVPLLLQRGRRLVTMSFGDILKELLPDAVANFQKLTGKSDG